MKQYNNNLEYWKNRYDKMPGEKVVGNAMWTSEQYESEYALWRMRIDPVLEGIKDSIHYVLDFGSGIGRWMGLLSKYCDYYYCCDIMKFNLPNFKQIKNNIIPFKNIKFDLIWACVTLQHVVDRSLLEYYLQQFYDLLNDNKYILIVENTSQNKNKNYLIFRSVEEYIKLFDKFKFTKVVIKKFISSGEEHSIILFKKG